jgi:Kef-type K+ transport system membrane component KefB
MSNVELTLQFFLQLAVILVTCRLVGLMATRFGQPQVVAEMVAGVLLGPSLLGWLAPDFQAWLFPWDRTQATRDTQSYLFPVSQLGLALYMFVVGMEFRIEVVASHFRSSMAVSIAGMLTPFLLGAGLAWVFFHYTQLFPTRTSAVEAMLFLGASMCITALPVLARLIHHKNLSGTTMGTISLGAGAIGDAAAWCLLAILLSTADSDWTQATRNIAGGAAYVAFVFLVVRPALARLQYRVIKDGQLTETGQAAGLTLMALGAWSTEVIGLHAVFGAFVMGAAIPRGVCARDLMADIQPLCVALLVPVFFAYSGLNTQITLLNTAYMWLICGVILAVAVVSKAVACTVAAIATGIPGREAVGIGILMNVRGLMELIMINIGLERGIISRELFATLVIMAIVTTLMASPLFERIVGLPRAQAATAAQRADRDAFAGAQRR